jgi:hypothetical protein
METSAVWKDFYDKSFYLYRNDEDEHPLVLYPNLCITWDGRQDYVKIVEVYGNESETGPRGFTYLPYRKEGRWSTPAFSLRGDVRFIICYPAGFPHYGIHIPLDTIRVDEAPWYMDPPGEMNWATPQTILELRHQILRMCSTKEVEARVKKNVYFCSKDDLTWKIHITRTEDGHRVDVYPTIGHLDDILKYVCY